MTGSNVPQDASFGLANVKQERTTLFDGNYDHFKTNFSSGMGRMFVDDTDQINDNYP
jgi:hypothetical protein